MGKSLLYISLLCFFCACEQAQFSGAEDFDYSLGAGGAGSGSEGFGEGSNVDSDLGITIVDGNEINQDSDRGFGDDENDRGPGSTNDDDSGSGGGMPGTMDRPTVIDTDSGQPMILEVDRGEHSDRDRGSCQICEFINIDELYNSQPISIFMGCGADEIQLCRIKFSWGGGTTRNTCMSREELEESIERDCDARYFVGDCGMVTDMLCLPGVGSH